MEGMEKAPTYRDTTELPGGSRLGNFWAKCKHLRKCVNSPYDRLLDNPLLRADYHTSLTPHTQRHERETASPEVKVEAVRNKLTVLRMMEGREEAPKRRDTTELPGWGTLGNFWKKCKGERKCGRPPYDRLLGNSVLRTDYRTTKDRYEKAIAKSKMNADPETKVQAVRAQSPLWS